MVLVFGVFDFISFWVNVSLFMGLRILSDCGRVVVSDVVLGLMVNNRLIMVELVVFIVYERVVVLLEFIFVLVVRSEEMMLSWCFFGVILRSVWIFLISMVFRMFLFCVWWRMELILVVFIWFVGIFDNMVSFWKSVFGLGLLYCRISFSNDGLGLLMVVLC